MVQIAFDNVTRKLDTQRADLAVLRNQASVSGAMTGLIGTLFATLLGAENAQQVISGEFILGISLPACFVFVLFASSVACSILVLVGYSDFVFSFDSRVIARAVAKGNEDTFGLSSLIHDGEWYFSQNEVGILRAQSLLWWSMVLGFSQILPWITLILGSHND